MTEITEPYSSQVRRDSVPDIVLMGEEVLNRIREVANGVSERVRQAMMQVQTDPERTASGEAIQ
jgi:hypothetical protein